MSKKGKSAIVSGAGWISGFWHLMDKEMRRQGWTNEQIHTLVTETEPEGQPIARIVQAMAIPSVVKPNKTAKKMYVFEVTYDQSHGLVPLIQWALGADCVDCFDGDINQERFPLRGTDIQKVKCRVEAYLDGETGPAVADRLAKAGCVLASTGDLAGFLHDHPRQAAKFLSVEVVNEDSRWTDSSGHIFVPSISVDADTMSSDFQLEDFCEQHYPQCGVLVLCEPACNAV